MCVLGHKHRHAIRTIHLVSPSVRDPQPKPPQKPIIRAADYDIMRAALTQAVIRQAQTDLFHTIETTLAADLPLPEQVTDLVVASIAYQLHTAPGTTQDAYFLTLAQAYRRWYDWRVPASPRTSPTPYGPTTPADRSLGYESAP